MNIECTRYRLKPGKSGTGGIDVEESSHWIDKQHLAYWDQCIDPSFKPVNLKTKVVMIPDKVKSSMV